MEAPEPRALACTVLRMPAPLVLFLATGLVTRSFLAGMS
jgi:hypothetical protein